jgi:hypothetical protein
MEYFSAAYDMMEEMEPSGPILGGRPTTLVGLIITSILQRAEKHSFKQYQPLNQVCVFSGWLKIKAHGLKGLQSKVKNSKHCGPTKNIVKDSFREICLSNLKKSYKV